MRTLGAYYEFTGAKTIAGAKMRYFSELIGRRGA